MSEDKSIEDVAEVVDEHMDGVDEDKHEVAALKSFDVSRALRLAGLPTSLKDDDESKLREVVCETISTALKLANNDWLESVAKLPLNTEGKEESQTQAVVVFKSRIHKHRVYTQRAKLDAPVEVFPITLEEADSWGLKEEASDDKSKPVANGVSKNAGEKTFPKKGDSTNKDKDGEPRFVVDWDGAPEFQWRVPETDKDARSLVIENISLGDLDSAWLYQSMMRARNVDYSAHSSNYKGSFDHNLLRRGTLTLTYPTDNAAMAQAVNGMVCIRTRPNKRIKIYLPQTPNTLRMKNLLEMKLGRVHKPNLKSRQLLVRQVGSEDAITDDVVKKAFHKIDSGEIESVEFRDDAMKRRCAVVTFKTPENAIWAHIKHDEVKTAQKNKFSRVFYMQDVQEPELLLKPEMRDIGNPVKRARSRSPPGGENKRGTNISTAPRGGGPMRGGRGGPMRGGGPSFRDGGRGGGGMMGGRGAVGGPAPYLGGGGAPQFRRGEFRDEASFAGRRDDRFGGGAPFPRREENDWNRGAPASALPQAGAPMGAVAAGADPVYQMQAKLKLQEDQLQMQNRIMQQTDLIKDLADELKKVRSGGPTAPVGADAAPAAFGQSTFRDAPRETSAAAGFGRSYGGIY